MARKVCTAGAVGSFSFLILEDQNAAIASIRSRTSKELVSRHVDIKHATNWVDRLVREMNGKRYEID